MTKGESVRVLERALEVIQFVAEQGEAVGVTRIAQATGIPKATVHRILTTLEESKVVARENGQYFLGPAVLFWSTAYRHRSSLIQVARPKLVPLWEEVRETVHLVMFEGGEAFYLDKMESPHPVRMHSRVGARLCLYSTASGKAILASLPEPELELYLRHTKLEPRTERTITDPARLREELKLVRERGFALDDLENEEGIRCVGSSIVDFRGYPLGAISVSVPAYRFSLEQAMEVGPRVREVALEVSRGFGFLRGLSLQKQGCAGGI